MDWKMLNTDEGNRIRGSRRDAVVVDPAVLIDLAESAAREGLIRQWNTRFKN